MDAKSRRGILVATILPSTMVIIFGTAIALALPTIQKYFATDFSGIQWIVTAYTLTLGVLILMSGSLGDIFGRKRIFMTGLIIFSVGSFTSGFAQSINLLLIFQVMMGIGAAMVVPGSLAIINTCFHKSNRGHAIGLWTGFITGGAVVAPFIGGWLVENFGWQAIYFFNVLLGILALLASFLYIPADKHLRKSKIDWLGIIFIGTGLLGISFGLIQTSIISLLAGLTLLPVFVWWERHTKYPLVSLHIFKNKLVRGANLVTLFLYTALNGLIYFAILHFQQVQDLSPFMAGIAFMPAPLLITLLAGPFGSWSDKIGPRLPMILGPALVTIAFLLLTLVGPNSSYFIYFLPGLILLGIGMAITVAPLTKSALSVKPQHSGAASGINNAISRIATPLSVAVFGLLVQDSLTNGFPLIMAACAGFSLVSVITAYFTIHDS